MEKILDGFYQKPTNVAHQSFYQFGQPVNNISAIYSTRNFRRLGVISNYSLGG